MLLLQCTHVDTQKPMLSWVGVCAYVATPVPLERRGHLTFQVSAAFPWSSPYRLAVRKNRPHLSHKAHFGDWRLPSAASLLFEKC